MKNMIFSGNENIDYSQYTKKTFGGRKVFLLIMAILATVSDFALLVVFAISGHGGLAIPIILLILDGLFIAGVCLSNFRFKYSIGIWTAYLVISVVVTSILAVLDSGDTYMTDTAKTLNVFAHVALYLVTVLASVYPLFKNNLKIKAIMVVSVCVAVILVGAFAVYFSANGYFGQGFLGEYRVVGYTLDEESDTYIASSIKNGRSNKVVIPEEFNGKKVSGVNCSIFTHTSIKTVEIQSQEQINFVENQYLTNINPDIKIGVDKKYIDAYRKSFLKPNYYPEDPYMRMFSNCMYPVNLEENERYITFEYDQYPKQNEIIPTWIGKVGQEFQLDYADGVDYLKHADANNVSDLVWCYDHNGAKILTGDIVNLAGDKINSDKYRVAVDFTDVYRVKIADDNDDIYEPSDVFKTTVVGDNVYDYRFITVESASGLLTKLSEDLIEDRDNGFNLSWSYNINLKSGFSQSNSWHVLIDLSYELEQLAHLYEGNTVDIKIKPIWEMKAPTGLAIIFNSNSYVYGDDVIMNVSAIAPNKDCKMQFEWSYTGNGAFERNSTDKYVITNALPQYGTFGVKISVSSDKSSLTSSGYVDRVLRVNKKPLNITWQEPADMVYNNQEKVLQHFVGAGELINGDVLANFIDEYNVRNVNAGKYTARISLLGSIDQKYVISTGASYDYVISPRPTQAEWTCGDYTYDGESHNAFATAQDIYGIDLPVSLSGAVINAGKYTATASSADSNYQLTNNTYEFEIKQKVVTATWSNAQLIYSGVAQHPRATVASGLVGYDNIDNQLIYSGYFSNIDAGEGYSVKVDLLPTSNYKFDSEQSTSYNIEKRALRIHTQANNKVYDGKANSFDFAVVSGLASVHTKSSLGNPIYSGNGAGAVDAGNYSVMVSLPTNDVTKNYDITYSGATFNITKAQVALNWSEAVVKDGVVIPPTASVSGSVTSDDIDMGDYVFRDVFDRVIDKIPYASGTYSVEVNPTSKNCSFTNTRINFTITVEAENREVA